eukprot:CAMPEP_0113957260 /NCGR_PEP_ID=MMETSP0011_2-20120614/2666_1 /TAXON_ID=101924 /ORGANISM="Rhodosorus marinus" /LENGTH=476 /DNA_ID=CAMNT_0000967793 /DNA_START=155 /DNA_END=1585 /DNA_ORIENTATION=- /assembly_acc=CAM_ASM_000156
MTKRKVEEELLVTCARESWWYEGELITLKLVAYARDVRGGKGERRVGRLLMKWLAKEYPDYLELNLKLFVEKYGRFDDLFVLMDTPLEDAAVNLACEQIKNDLEALERGGRVSLMAKWVPSEGKSLDKKSGVTGKIAERLANGSKETLRKKYISPLREHLKIVERHMCAGQWSEIDYNVVPSCAMANYSAAFMKHSEEKFTEWKAGLADGKSKVNASVLFPHEIVKSYISFLVPGPNHPMPDDELWEAQWREIVADELLEAQWREIVKRARDAGELGNTLAICDVSPSMYYCQYAALLSLSLGCLISDLADEPFKDLVITFAAAPQLVNIGGPTLLAKLRKLHAIPWGCSTNFIAALNLVLTMGKKANLPPESMPTRLIVISDMQFDYVGPSGTNYETIKKMYEESHYELPHIVFWNVSGKARDYQVTADESNVSLVSGFSTRLLKCVLSGSEPTPYTTMMAAIDDERYDALRLPE